MEKAISCDRSVEEQDGHTPDGNAARARRGDAVQRLDVSTPPEEVPETAGVIEYNPSKSATATSHR